MAAAPLHASASEQRGLARTLFFLHQQNLGLIFGIFSGLSKDRKALKDRKMCIFEKMVVVFSE
jgi:hypothetical protein